MSSLFRSSHHSLPRFQEKAILSLSTRSFHIHKRARFPNGAAHQASHSLNAPFPSEPSTSPTQVDVPHIFDLISSANFFNFSCPGCSCGHLIPRPSCSFGLGIMWKCTYTNQRRTDPSALVSPLIYTLLDWILVQEKGEKGKQGIRMRESNLTWSTSWCAARPLFCRIL